MIYDVRDRLSTIISVACVRVRVLIAIAIVSIVTDSAMC